MTENKICKMLGIEYPIIMAPMFLVSNTQMVIEALKSGITAALPALNYKTDKELRNAIKEIKSTTDKPFGINLIVNKSNSKLKQQLKTVIDLNIDFVITSLGNPKQVISQCKPLGIKVFCDVVDLKFATKVEKLGADALIAVNNSAGGHAGNLSANKLIPLLKSNCKIPIISAGGVCNHMQLNEIMALGADGVSVGTPFIASEECTVSKEYKNAIVNFGEKDIVTTNKMSGSPLSVINTPYVQEIGTEASFFEKLLNKNKTLKKYAKLLIFNKGMKTMEKAAFKATYKTVWVAGPGIEHVKSIKKVSDIIKQIINPGQVH